MIELIKKSLNKLNVDFGEINIQKRDVLSLVLSNGVVENISKNETLAGNITCFKK